MKLAILTLVVIAAAVALAACSQVSAAPVPQAGETAPDFTLPSQDGSSVSLHDFHGRWVVLYFYPKDGTSGCTLEAHNFQHDIAKYETDNAVILGVSVDSTGSHKEFCAQQGLTFKLLADTDKQVSAQYGSLMNLVAMKIAKRNTFLIDPQGRIRKVWTGVNPGPHSAEVLTELAQLK